MSAEPEKNSENLRKHFEREMGPITWHEIEMFFASGMVVEVSSELDLIDVAVCFVLDDTETIQSWLADMLIRRMSDENAKRFSENNSSIRAVVARPWVLVQE